ncbi:hypothetical protein U0070_020946, partial [Myodes glareolus]
GPFGSFETGNSAGIYTRESSVLHSQAVNTAHTVKHSSTPLGRRFFWFPLLTYLESTPDLEETCSESSFPRKLISVLVPGTHLNWKKILPRPRPGQGKVGGSEQN